MPYIGTGCKEFLKGRNVYMRPQESQDSVENKLKMLFRGEIITVMSLHSLSFSSHKQTELS